MKKINAALFALAAIYVGTVMAQTPEKTISRPREKVQVKCEQVDDKASCAESNKRIPRPPRPPLPPLPPAPPTAPDAPDAPPLPDTIESELDTGMPEVPPLPPLPPAPPELKVPAQAHAACEGKSLAEKISWSPNKDEHYAGVCVQKAGGMFFDVHQHRIERSNRK